MKDGILANDLYEREELNNCKFVKTVLMFLIVIYHGILFWRGGWFSEEPLFEAKYLGTLADWLNSFHIYAFTLVSGYIFYYVKVELGGIKHFLSF